jgi:hypothetical protein
MLPLMIFLIPRLSNLAAEEVIVVSMNNCCTRFVSLLYLEIAPVLQSVKSSIRNTTTCIHSILTNMVE